MKTRLSAPAVLVSAVLAAPCWAQPVHRSYFKSQLAVEHNLPFSSGILAGDTLYIAGTSAFGPEGPRKPVGAEAEARLVMDKVKTVVEEAGMTMDDVVSMQVFCTDLNNYDAFNRVYATYFHGKYPARAFIGASTLLFHARYEVMGIAVKP